MQQTRIETTSRALPNCKGEDSTAPSLRLPTPEICVICLYKVSELAICLPCRHDQFDFSCLGTWLQQQQVCPLCKQRVEAIRYNEAKTGSSRIFQLPKDDLPQRSTSSISRRRQRYRSGRHILHRDVEKDISLAFRRDVYGKQMSSSHVGSNAISGYRNINPGMMSSDPKLVTKARIFIRRELRVFDFLNPDSESFGTTDRRATNAEFLLEYIIAILKAIDIKGSNGQAEELLKDYLGRDNARLFLHELCSWLRSPYERLEEWDRNVQYAEPRTAPEMRRENTERFDEHSTSKKRALR